MRTLGRLHPGARRARARPLRTLLLFGMLVPLLGATLVAGTVIRERNDVRTASLALEARAADLALQTQFVSALGQEEIHSNVLGLATTYGAQGHRLDIDLGVARARLAGGRALVDSARFTDIRDALGLGDGLGRLRERLDDGVADYDEVSGFFAATDEAIEGAWRDAMDEVSRYADREALPDELRRRLRSLRATMAAFAVTDDRVAHSLAHFLEPLEPERTRDLIDAAARFDAALDEALQVASPALTAAWSRWEADPAARRTEATMALAEQIGLGVAAPLPAVDPTLLAQGLTDGARWATLLTDIARVAAVDLELGASAHADAAARTMAAQLAAVGTLVIASLAVAALVARTVTKPVRRLEEAVRQVESGTFQLEHLPERGPRELAATARAFNDMSATLSAVEAHAVALAGDAGAPALTEKLPGRTGEAMQAALDRLRASIADAEERRHELARLAAHDALTGLLNRGAATEAVERDLARARRDGTSLLALYVDLDGLKQINDTHGHAAGDEAIRRTAAALRASTRDGDVVARLGGDEFLVVGPLPAGGRPVADALALRVRDAVRAQVVPLGEGAEIPLRCSVGAAIATRGIGSMDQLVIAADLALYEAKAAGRDRVAWAPEEGGRVPAPA